MTRTNTITETSTVWLAPVRPGEQVRVQSSILIDRGQLVEFTCGICVERPRLFGEVGRLSVGLGAHRHIFAGGWLPLAVFGRIPLRQVVSGRMTDLTVSWDVRPWKVVVMALVSVIALAVAVIPLWDQVLSRL